jgi:hypothetical protein
MEACQLNLWQQQSSRKSICMPAGAAGSSMHKQANNI